MSRRYKYPYKHKKGFKWLVCVFGYNIPVDNCTFSGMVSPCEIGQKTPKRGRPGNHYYIIVKEQENPKPDFLASCYSVLFIMCRGYDPQARKRTHGKKGGFCPPVFYVVKSVIILSADVRENILLNV